jgi:sterol desaturase/sphingolipid hydroxylase (fatty acid hydroxylase superfamily)
MPWIKFAGASYWTLFVATFLAVAVWESIHPKHPLAWPAERRWGYHAILMAISGIAQTAVFRLSPVVVAAAAADNRFGILNRSGFPLIVQCLIAVPLLDLVHYGVHRAFHSAAFLWRVHEIHHSDPDYDVSTAGRFHPIEVVAGQGMFIAAVILLAPPPIAVFISVLLTVVLNLFVHANAALPQWAERMLRYVFVTPNLHRIHHSEEIYEQSRNLGQTFIWWDRLFGTYTGRPDAGEEGIKTGIKGLQNADSLGLGFMLAKPFRSRSENPADTTAAV